MLRSALEHYRRQQRITALGLTEARRGATRGSGAVIRALARYQAASIALTMEFSSAELQEQGIDAPPQGQVVPAALLTSGAASSQMLARTANAFAFDRLIATLINDAGRTAATVDLGRRPALTGHVRSLNPPSCSRCAVLAGRVYRYSTGFLRHPGCDCLMTPTTESAGRDLILDGEQAVRDGQVRGLSSADREALGAGGDLGQVVNVRRQGAGLTVGSSVVARAGRPTPQGILSASPSREDAIERLRAAGYLT